VTTALFVAAGACALGDWFAVWRRLYRLEYVLKPLTLTLLIAAAATADLYFLKGWVVAALVFGLLGDIGLMLSDDRKPGPDAPFMLGLGSFLFGHVCYIAAFLRYGMDGPHVIAGLLMVAGVAVLTLPAVLAGAKRLGGNELAAVVGVYTVLLAAMTVTSIGTGVLLTAVGGVLFLGSDTLIATERFVHPVPHGRVLVIASYHVAQFLIVAGLIAAF
jgi:uncharacterized membrane protein YhhN